MRVDAFRFLTRLQQFADSFVIQLLTTVTLFLTREEEGDSREQLNHKDILEFKVPVHNPMLMQKLQC